MPFSVIKVGNKWAVKKLTDDKKIIRGRYNTKQSALNVKKNYENYVRKVYKEKI